MLRDIRFLLGVALYALLMPSGLAQVEFREPNVRQDLRLNVEWWERDKGLPQQSVTSIAQTEDGYIWIGTFGGLVRFDGVKMQVYDVGNTIELGSNRITSLLAASDGSLWIGTENAGACRYVDGRFVPVLKGVGAVVANLRESPNGTVWLCHAVLSSWKNGVLTHHDDGRPAEISPQNDLYLTDQGDYLVGTTSAVDLWDGESRRELLRGETRRFFKDPSGSPWGLGDGLFQLQPENYKQYRNSDAKPPLLTCAITTRDGLTWVGGGSGLYLWENPPTSRGESPNEILLTRVKETSGSEFERSIRHVSSLLEDREGNLWVGTYRSGLCRIQVNRKIEDINLNVNIYAFVHLDSERVLATDGTDELFEIQADGSRSTIAPEPGRGNLRDLKKDSAGRIWTTHGGQIYQFLDDQLVPIEGLRGEVILVGKAGQIWSAEANSLFEFDGENLTTHALDESPDRTRSPVIEGGDGSIWLCSDSALERWRDGAIRERFNLESLGLPELRSFVLDPEGSLWFTSYGAGLFRLRDGQLTSLDTSDGLRDDSLGRIFLESDGTFWINSNRGVFSLSRRTAEACLDGLSSRVHCEPMYTPEGNGGWGERDATGRLWFPTINGLVGIEPHHTQNPLPPPISIEDLIVDGTHYPPGELATFPPGSGRLEVVFSVLSLVDPELVHARYRLLGREDEWVEIGDRRTAYFTNLEPGNYTFEITACNNDNVWNEIGVRQRFTLKPRYYQTEWFMTLALGAVMLLSVAFYRLRVASVKATNRELNQEIQSRQRVEVALRQSEENYRAVAETATDGIIVVDSELRIRYANHAAERMFEFGVEQAEGSSLTKWVGLPDLAETEQRTEASLELEKVLEDCDQGSAQLIGRRNSGHQFPLEVSSGKMLFASKEPARVCILRDTTERRQLEQQLSENNKLEAIGRLAGGVAHDFNNILTALIGHAQLLTLELDDAEEGQVYVEHVDQITLAADRASNLVQQLMTFSRQRAVERKPTSPNRIIQGLMPMLERLIETRITIELDLESNLGHISIDEHQFEQVIVNLVVNARDAIDAQGTILISTRTLQTREIREVEISVTDTGIGMTEEDRSKIFEPFFTTKPVDKGTGMGLATVHGIVSQFDGKILVESDIEIGSRFVLTFPWSAEESPECSAPAPAAQPKRAADASLGEGTILLCDDDDEVRKVAAITLKNYGYRVLVAEGPLQALDFARDHEGPIAALITDVVMPVMTGPALARTLTSQLPDLPVLFISGYLAENNLLEGLDARAAFLEKPFLPAELIENLQELLAGIRSRTISTR